MKPRAAILLCVAAMLGTVVVPLWFGDDHSFTSLSSFQPWAIGCISLLMLTSWIAKGLKFQMLVKRLGQRCALVTGIAMALGCDFAFIATPAGLGGYAATVFLCRRAGASASAGTAVAAADQTLDLVFFTACIPLAVLWLVANGTPVGLGADRLPLLLAPVVVCAMALRAIGRDRWSSLANRLMRLPLLRRYDNRVRRSCADVLAHLRELYRAPPSHVAALLGFTTAQWLARYAVLGVALAGFGHGVPVADVLLLQSIALHVGQWTGVPGGVGGADLIIAQGLRPWAPLAAIAGAILVWRVATLYGTLLAGAVAFAGLSIWRRDRVHDASRADGLSSPAP